MDTNIKIGFIGGGAIAEAIIGGILQQKLVEKKNVIAIDIVAERRTYLENTYGICTSGEAAEATANANVLFLTVKPQVVQKVLASLENKIPSTTLVISVVAGLTLSSLQKIFLNQPVIRVMPNTPVAVGAGMSAIALGDFAEEIDRHIAEEIFGSVGKAVVLDESLIDAVTGLSGSGPGYGFVIIDALADAGVRAGLPRKTAIMLAAQTLLGSAQMVLNTGKHPGELRDMVTSPGGTTIAGIYEMEKAGVRAALIAAVEAATEKSKSMGKK